MESNTQNASVIPTEQKPKTGIQKISAFLNAENVKTKFTEILGSRGQGFVASVLAACSQNESLKKATTESIYSAALMAATLDLPINPNLGFAFLIPYTKNSGKQNEITEAQFQISAKGFKQLAQRSGQFKLISESIVYEGQLVSENPLEGFKFDWNIKSDVVIGYVSYFRLTNGFESTFYMSKQKAEAHALKYSQTYKSPTKWIKDSSKWTTDFDAMALKTVTKLNLSKNAPLSIEMQKAILSDQAVLNTDLQNKYVDNTIDVVDINKEEERIELMIADIKTLADLAEFQENNPNVSMELINKRKQELQS
jgi:recombination protein RecT